MAYLGPEPDRWREKSELALKLSQEPDHFIDLELVEGMTLPPDRYSFYRALNAKREQTPGKPDTLLPEKVGLQPYITMEVYGRLVVAFREYRHALRDHKSTEFAERDAIFYAGWLGHYVADGANPLHTTVNYNGWTTANPERVHDGKEHPLEDGRRIRGGQPEAVAIRGVGAGEGDEARESVPGLSRLPAQIERLR